MALPWQDRLARAKIGPVAAGAPASAPAGAMPGDSNADALASAAPGLRRLTEERAALERKLAQLTGGAPADPRYPVASSAARRAEFARWSAQRDTPDAAATARTGPSVERTSSHVFPPPPLRMTPGEVVPAGRVPVDTARWAAARDVAVAPDGGGRLLSDAGRALAAVGSDQGRGDPLDRRLERARDLAGRGRRSWLASLKALDAARDAIPAAWAERAKERIPGLGRADPYVRDTARKLRVAVGTLAEVGDKADQLREQALAVRELKAADAAHDDARHERALARRQAGRGGDASLARDRPHEDAAPFASDRQRARKEAAHA